MNKRLTKRGFELYEFEDSYGCKCNLQESSNIIPHIWLGLEKIEPMIMMRDVAIDQEAENVIGWVKYPVPENVLMRSRMHLNVEQVKELIVVLQEFVDKN